MPEFIDVFTVRSKAMKLFSNMYNVMRKSYNVKMNLLCQISVHSPKKGIIGSNVSVISKHSACGFDFLVYNDVKCDRAVKARASAIKDITLCIEGSSYIDGFSFDELVMFKNYIACF